MEHVPGLERLGQQIGWGRCEQEMTTGNDLYEAWFMDIGANGMCMIP